MPAKVPSRKTHPASVMVGSSVIRLDVPKVMGIVNVTPDSFSGDGLGADAEAAIEKGEMMFVGGADIVDIGGESTRPGAEPVSSKSESMRTLKVVKTLAARHPDRISIDTMKPEVAEQAILAGASTVNDVGGLRDPRMIGVVAEHGASVIIMHMKGEPRTMQSSPSYEDVVREVMEFLENRVSAAEDAGVDPRRIMIDPGIGFGKGLEHNLEILARLGEFKGLGKPVVIGVSRKSFIGRMTGEPVENRLDGSIAAAVLAVMEGADIVRVHDVPETVRALKVASGISSRARR